MRATGSSRSCASSVGSTGWSATISTASIARLASSLIVRSPVVGVDLGESGHPTAAFHRGGVSADPRDGQVAEVGRLLQLDEPLLVELEDGEEAHDDLEPLDERA